MGRAIPVNNANNYKHYKGKSYKGRKNNPRNYQKSTFQRSADVDQERVAEEQHLIRIPHTMLKALSKKGVTLGGRDFF